MKKMPQLDRLLMHIQAQGLRRTTQRKILLQTLLRLKSSSTIERIYRQIPKNSCDLATIYRSLQQLEAINLVQRTYLSNGTALFSLKQENQHPAHHIQCKKCETVVIIDNCFLKESTQQLKKLGFRDISHRLEFFGICSRCA